METTDKVQFFTNLVGKKCWSTVAGPGTGSMVSLAFGERIRRAVPIKNLTLPVEQREFTGEFVIFLKCGSWQIERGGKIVCNSNHSNKVGDVMLAGLNQLVGKIVTSVDSAVGLSDFVLNLDGGLRLGVTCAQDINVTDCYTLHHLEPLRS